MVQWLRLKLIHLVERMCRIQCFNSSRWGVWIILKCLLIDPHDLKKTVSLWNFFGRGRLGALYQKCVNDGDDGRIVIVYTIMTLGESYRQFNFLLFQYVLLSL
jgi:hypothetical protein